MEYVFLSNSSYHLMRDESNNPLLQLNLSLRANSDPKTKEQLLEVNLPISEEKYQELQQEGKRQVISTASGLEISCNQQIPRLSKSELNDPAAERYQTPGDLLQEHYDTHEQPGVILENSQPLNEESFNETRAQGPKRVSSQIKNLNRFREQNPNWGYYLRGHNR